MGTSALIVQNVSFAHVRNIVGFIHDQLCADFDPDLTLHLVEQIVDAPYDDGSVVFVIGEGFSPHQRRPGCFYIYLNFSIVEVLGNPLKMSRDGWSAIRRKKQMLTEKLAGFDLILDYFAPQSAVLARKLDVPVLHFPVAVGADVPASKTPLRDRPYDICFVGAITPRRAEVLDNLAAQGWHLSPHRDVTFEQAAGQSKCCLNIHAHRSNHLEVPRIIGALSVGCPVVTEQSFGLKTLLPEGLCVSVRHGVLAQKTDQMLRNLPDMEALQSQTSDWYQRIYLPQCRQRWADLAAGINAARQAAKLPMQAAGQQF